ncbi:hypothetical protein JTE90_026798 [Oedothorax gibbosus]|uniref:DNA-directed RNA polymerase I subunit RPA43 n=1 Tax=Oedothorax gibbosus TaxID=931172 RepID=A0AAV6URZ3_9ARAC|nr:hypothetical protein JTE90_026798 [Oedothorax gibbosus]
MDPEKFSCIRTVDKTVKIPLWDMYTTTEYKGIEAALDKWKRQYEKQVGGIVVNYKNISIPSRLGFHSDRGSYAIYHVKATFDIFCPKVGEIVKGKINRVSSEHIGCLIAETINVSIRLPRDAPCGLSKYIYLDREILFEIRSFSCKPRALCVNGEITATCIELMDEYYPVADEFSYEPTSQAVFGDVPSDGDQQVNLAILGTDRKKKKGKKRGRDETEENATDSPRVKKIKKDLDLTNSQEEGTSSTATPKKGKKKKSSMNSPKPKKSKKSLIAANGPETAQEDGDTSSTDTSKKLKKEGSTDSPKVKKIQQPQEESSSFDTPKKAKKKKSSSTDSLKVSQEDSSSTESAKKIVSKSTDSSQESESSSTESDKKETKKSSNKKAKKKASKSAESPTKIKKEMSSTEDEGSKKKGKKKLKKKSKESAKDKKKSSKKKGKITASGDILKKDKKKSKKSSKTDDKSKKKSKKDKSEKKKKTKLSNDGDVNLKQIKSEGM